MPLHEWLADVLRVPMEPLTNPAQRFLPGRIFGPSISLAFPRMPIGFSAAVLEALFGSEFALSWMLLMQRPVSPGRLKWRGASVVPRCTGRRSL